MAHLLPKPAAYAADLYFKQTVARSCGLSQFHPHIRLVLFQ
jgi:hypothetical protein